MYDEDGVSSRANSAYVAALLHPRRKTKRQTLDGYLFAYLIDAATNTGLVELRLVSEDGHLCDRFIRLLCQTVERFGQLESVGGRGDVLRQTVATIVGRRRETV